MYMYGDYAGGWKKKDTTINNLVHGSYNMHEI